MREQLNSNTIYRFFRLIMSIGIAFFLVACGDDEELERKKALFETYTIADLQTFVDKGQFDQAVEALHFYQDEGTATNEHMYLLARVYIIFGDGIAAEVAIERLRDRGVSEEDTALMLAQSLMLQNRARDAERALRDMQLPADQLFDAFLLRGDIARSLDELGRANQFYEAAIETNPESFRGHAALALLALQQGDLDKAEELSVMAATRMAEDPIVEYVQGMVARYKGRIDEAQKHFEKALELNDTNVLSRIELIGVYLIQDNLPAAKKEIDLIYERSPNNPMANYYTALMIVNEGKFDEAEDLMLRTGDFTQSYPPAAQIYGMTIYELKKYSTAIPYLKRALNFYPNDGNLRLALADSLTHRGQSAEALRVLAPFIEEGSNIDGLVQASAAASGLGDLRSARRYTEQALALAEKNDGTSDELIKDLRKRVAFARFLDNDVDGANSLLSKMYENDPSDIETLLNKANILLSTGDVSGAEDALSKIIAANAESAAASNLLGAIRHRQGRFDEAIEAYSKAIEKAPTYQSALKNRAMSYIASNDYIKARKDLEVLIGLAPDEAQVAAMLGRALLETGEAEAAIHYLEQAAEAMPGSALVMADHADAMANLGYYSSAINLARKAKTLAPSRDDFIQYLDGQIKAWNTALADEAVAEQEARAKQLEKEAEALAKERQMMNSITKDADQAEETGPSQDDLLAELKALAEARRKSEQERQQADNANVEKIESGPETSLSNKSASELEQETVRLERNIRFGRWLASELELPDSEVSAYVDEIIRADTGEAGNSDIIRKALNDLEAAGLQMTTQAIEQKLEEFLTAKVDNKSQD